MPKRFSKDPKVKVVPIKQFLENSNYLFDVKGAQWKEKKRPSCGTYYKITPKYLIAISYDLTISFSISGRKFSERLYDIIIAFRDGKTEYELFDAKVKTLIKKQKRTKNIEIANEISNVKDGRKFIEKIQYDSNNHYPSKRKTFDNFIVDTNYKTSSTTLIGKYVVFDVETNGIRKANDDLLSFSIFDPSTGLCYNRFLPLDLQPLVLTGWLNGITTKKLEKAQHLTQEEVDKIIDFFDLKDKTLLSYSGGQGTFDSSFIINYCKRHNLIGFDNLRYENIKSMCPIADSGFEGQITKDNMCKLFKIDGVEKVHSSLNDCILEWKLFEKIKGKQLFFIDQNLYQYNENYIIPVTCLNKHPEIANYAGISIPYLTANATTIFEYSLPPKILKRVKKFPTNITGISIESGISAALNVEEKDNSNFLIENKKQLQYIGSLDCPIRQIPIIIRKDGTLKSLDCENNDYIDEINEITKIIIKSLSPVLNFIANEIFKTSKIFNQELSISPDGKVLAICDLSNEESVLEIKTFNVFSRDGEINKSLVRQLYYESNGRKTFILSIIFNERVNNRGKVVLDDIKAIIYDIKIEETEPKQLKK